ncbi:hypothetical protein ACJX0J_015479, partial [Zea mays]
VTEISFVVSFERILDITEYVKVGLYLLNIHQMTKFRITILKTKEHASEGAQRTDDSSRRYRNYGLRSGTLFLIEAVVQKTGVIEEKMQHHRKDNIVKHEATMQSGTNLVWYIVSTYSTFTKMAFSNNDTILSLPLDKKFVEFYLLLFLTSPGIKESLKCLPFLLVCAHIRNDKHHYDMQNLCGNIYRYRYRG